MSRPVSHAAIVAAIVAKDVREFSRDRLWLVLTTIGLVMFIAVFWVLPSSVDETISVGVYPPDLADSLLDLASSEGETGQGLRVVRFDSAGDLRAVVAGEMSADESGDVAVGLAFPSDFTTRASSGETSAVTVYVGGGVPPEVRDAMESAVREIAYLAAAAAAGDAASALPVRQDTVVLGEDRAGRQVPLQERMRPMLAYFVLMMESMALASLIALEIQRRTVTALMVTPARVSDILAAKATLGTALAFSQAVILLALTGSFGDGWSVLLTAALAGALIATGTALISGAAGRDFMGTLFLGMALIIPLAIPAVIVLLPGSAATWVKAMPTYGVVEALVGVTSYGDSWSELWGPLLAAGAWCAAILGAGLAVLRRRVRSL